MNKITDDFINSEKELMIKSLIMMYPDLTDRQKLIANYSFACGMNCKSRMDEIIKNVFKK